MFPDFEPINIIIQQKPGLQWEALVPPAVGAFLGTVLAGLINSGLAKKNQSHAEKLAERKIKIDLFELRHGIRDVVIRYINASNSAAIPDSLREEMLRARDQVQFLLPDHEPKRAVMKQIIAAGHLRTQYWKILKAPDRSKEEIKGAEVGIEKFTREIEAARSKFEDLILPYLRLA